MKNIIYIILVLVFTAFHVDHSYNDLNEALKKPRRALKLKLKTCVGFEDSTHLERIGELKYLKELEISECASVRALPNSITSLKELKILRFNWNSGDGNIDWNNEFKKIVKLDKLEELNLSPYNIIGDLSKDIGKLTHLKVLNLNLTRTNSLPSEIGNLKSLEIIDIGQTSIRDLPIELFSLPNLKRIIIRDSKLAEDSLKVVNLRKQLPNCEIIN